jgi:hypothetical protein
VEIEEAVMAHLKAHAGLAALVGSRIHYDELVQDEALPAVGIIQVSDVKQHFLTGQSKLEQPIYQFTAYAETKAAARAVANQLKAALADCHGTLSGIVVQKIELQNELSSLETRPDGTVKVYAIDLEFEVTFIKE